MEEKQLKSLEQHNLERTAAFRKAEERYNPHPNGIACPKCGEELWDSDPRSSFTSGFNPSKTSVHCHKCDFRGSRYI